MKPYLIVIDLDFSHYDQETVDYIKKLSHEGHKIMLATGRPLRSSYFVYEALGLDTPLINYNGARVTNPKDPNYPTTDLLIVILENYILENCVIHYQMIPMALYFF